jgi:hypothetical protein
MPGGCWRARLRRRPRACSVPLTPAPGSAPDTGTACLAAWPSGFDCADVAAGRRNSRTGPHAADCLRPSPVRPRNAA